MIELFGSLTPFHISFFKITEIIRLILLSDLRIRPEEIEPPFPEREDTGLDRRADSPMKDVKGEDNRCQAAILRFLIIGPDIFFDTVIEIQFFWGIIDFDCLGYGPFREYLLSPEVHDIFLQSPDHKWFEILPEFPTVGDILHLFVNQLDEPEEIGNFTVMRCCRGENEMAGLGTDRFRKSIPQIAGFKFMGFIEDDQIPLGREKEIHLLIVPTDINRDDHLIILGIGIAFDLSLNNCEIFVELLLRLFLPLDLKSRGADDKDPADPVPKQEFFHHESDHDGLPEPHIIGEQHADPAGDTA